MASWIRVDTNLGRDPRVLRAKRLLGVSAPTMLGMLVLLESEIAERHPSGELAAFDLETLADWGDWTGDLSLFERAIGVLTEGGKLFNWDQTQGRRLEELAKDAERKRQERERKAALRAARRAKGDAVDDEERVEEEGTAEDVRRTSAGRHTDVRRNGTERDVDVDEERRDRGARARAEGTPSPDVDGATGHEPGRTAAASPAPPRAERNAELPDDDATTCTTCADDHVALHEPVIARWRRTFYPAARSPLERRREVDEQLIDSLGGGAYLTRADPAVRAFGLTRLVAKCEAMLREQRRKPLRDPDKAIVVLLHKLADLSGPGGKPDPTLPGIQAATLHKLDVEVPPAAVRRAEEAEHALAWLATRADASKSIEKRLVREGWTRLGSDTCEGVREGYAVDLWISAGRPKPALEGAGT